jgi:hypothetical protein
MALAAALADAERQRDEARANVIRALLDRDEMLARATAALDQARATNAKLNRRAQAAEAVADDNVPPRRRLARPRPRELRGGPERGTGAGC